MAQLGGFALEGGDPRLSVDEGKGMASIPYTLPQLRKLHDSSVAFEEYYYYAQRTRAEEDATVNMQEESGGPRGLLSVILPWTAKKAIEQEAEKRGSVIAQTVNLSKPEKRAEISDEEWTNANRALRTATWGAIFFLITTDILGPFALPFAFGSMGWG